MTVERSPFFNFGASDIRIVSRTTKLSLAHARVIGDIGGDYSADTVEVSGGALNFPYAVAITGFKGSLKVNVKEYDPDTHAIMSGGSTAFAVAAAAGEVTDAANVTGTSVMAAAGLLAPTCTASLESTLKGGWYLLVAVNTTTFNIIALNMAHFARGTDVSYVDKTGIVNASPLTFPADPSATVASADLGLTFTRGASALSVTAGDSMIFYVKPGFVEAHTLTFGQAAATFDNVMVYLSSERDGGMTTFGVFYNCKCLGAPMPWKRKGYAEYDYTIYPQYDSALNAVGQIRTIREAW